MIVSATSLSSPLAIAGISQVDVSVAALIAFAAVVAIAWGMAGYYIARHYNQPGWSGVVLVLLLGAFGVLIIVLTARRYEHREMQD